MDRSAHPGADDAADLALDLARAAWEAVTPVCVALAALFAAFLGFNLVRSWAVMDGEILAVQVATVAWFALLAVLGRQPMPRAWLASGLGVPIAGAAALCTALVARATGDPLAVGVLGVPIIGVLALVLDTVWAMLAVIECAATVLVLPPPGLARLDVGFVIATCTSVGLGIHAARGRNHRRLASLRGKERAAHQARIEAAARLAGGLGHDFNNLLTVIAGEAQLLSDPTTRDDERATAAANLDEAVARATAVTGQLLAFSRRQLVRPARVEPRVELARLERLVRRSLPASIAIEVGGDARSAVVFDGGQLGQAVLNLAINARDAMPGGGRLRITARDVTIDDAPELDPAGLVSRPRRPGAYVAIAVEDDGTGMDEETLGHLFEPFFTTKPAGRGTGLGLAMVHGIVHQHGGFIEVRSRPGRGTTFTMFLPAAPTAAPTPAEPPACAPTPPTASSADATDAPRPLVPVAVDGGVRR